MLFTSAPPFPSPNPKPPPTGHHSSLLYQLSATDIACVVDDPALLSGVQIRLTSAEVPTDLSVWQSHVVMQGTSLVHVHTPNMAYCVCGYTHGPFMWYTL